MQRGMESTQKQHKRRKRWIGFAALVLCLIVCALYAWVASTPDGTYYEPHLGMTGNAYLVFKGGEIRLKTEAGTTTCGSYLKIGRDWVSGNGETIFEPTFIGIRTLSKTNSADHRFLLRRGLGWIADSRDYFRGR